MLQNELLTFYFELKLQVRKMENISLSEVCRLLASYGAVAISTLRERIRGSSQPCDRWREAHDLVNERAPSAFFSGQVIDRCACSGSSCLNPFFDMFMTRLRKGEILENLPAKHSRAKKKCLGRFILLGFYWFLN